MKLLYSILLLSAIIFLVAEPVSQDKAEMVAKIWYKEISNRSLANIKQVKTFENNGDICFYAFDFSPGFVLVSADDAAKPILGYSKDSPLPDKFDHPAIKDWLEMLKINIAYLKKNKLSNAQTKPEWQRIIQNNFANVNKNFKEPLIKTKWGYAYPYRMYCPLDSGSLSAPGCVATAMAQIIRYHQYPLRGNGQNSYYCPTIYPKKLLSVDFGSTNYDFAKMPLVVNTESSIEEQQETAKLMYHCGVAVDMRYTKSGSGAYYHDAFTAYKIFFNFGNDMIFDSKDLHDEIEWINLLKSNLDADLPINYSGSSESAGHAFICDGYDQNNLFHFNWGWSGYMDGYYQLGKLNPDLPGNLYSFNQDAIFNLKPRTQSENYIQLTSPTGRTKWKCGNTYQIRWKSNMGGNVRIILGNKKIAENLPNDGIFQFTPTQNFLNLFQNLKIISEQDSAIHSISKDVTIYKALSVSPYHNENLYKGDEYAISYNFSIGWFFDRRAKLELFRNSDYVLTIRDTADYDLQNKWLIPKNIPSGADYRFKVTSIADSSDYAYSTYSFSIAEPPAIKLFNPEENATFLKTNSCTISWRDSLAESVKIELFRADNFVQTIKDSISAQNGIATSFTWIVTDTLKTDSLYKIKISSLRDPSIFVFSPQIKIYGTVLRNCISGKLEANDSPFILSDSVTVLAGEKLILEPNTIVFLNNQKISIKGSLEAIGKKDKPILFSGGSLRFLGDNSNKKNLASNLQYCNFNTSQKSIDSSRSENDYSIYILNYTTLNISDSKLQHNYQKLLWSKNSNLKITNCVISYQQKGLFIENSSSQINGNIFLNNDYYSGSAIDLNNCSDIKLLNNSFIFKEPTNTDNDERNVVLRNSSPVFVNNILYFEPKAQQSAQADSIHHINVCDADSKPVFYNCYITNGIRAIKTVDNFLFSGTYNNCIEQNPDFNTSAENNFSCNLGDNSSLINAGSKGFSINDLPSNDLTGTSRFFGDCIDIGALENVSNIEKNQVYQFELNQNYPNPFNNSTSISYILQKPENIELRIYNIKGEIVFSQRINGLKGKNILTWDAKNCASGVYIYQLKSASSEGFKRMILLK